MRKLKVTHVITGLSEGGAQASLLRLVEATQHDVHHHIVSLTDMGVYGERITSLGIEVEAVNLKPGQLTPSGVIKLSKILKFSHPDVVQTWMYHADLLGGIFSRLICRVPVIWGIRNLHIDSSARATKFIAKLNALLSYFIPKKIVSVSDSAANYHKKIGYRDIFEIVPNGYNTDSPQVTKKDICSSKQMLFPDGQPDFIFGCVARWDPLKDHQNLITAFADFLSKHESLNCKLVLVGEGCDENNTMLRSLLLDYKVFEQVAMLGRRENIPELMKIFDVTVLSSKSEAFPNVLAESMLCGTPCVTTDVGDARRIVAEFGWIVPPEDYKALSRSLDDAYHYIGFNAKKMTDSISSRCHGHIAENFSLDAAASKYLKIWRDSLKEKNNK